MKYYIFQPAKFVTIWQTEVYVDRKLYHKKFRSIKDLIIYYKQNIREPIIFQMSNKNKKIIEDIWNNYKDLL
jgi:hypothetical protein